MYFIILKMRLNMKIPNGFKMIEFIKEKKPFISMFLDFDKNIKEFYINYYFEEYKIVMKEPIIRDKNQEFISKFDKFNITKYIFLINFG